MSMATRQIERQTYLGLKDHVSVLELLDKCRFPVKRWRNLGLKLGLSSNTLDIIESDHPSDIERCLDECLSRWLRRVDSVDERGGATCDSLSTALRSMKEIAVADDLDKEKRPHILVINIFESHYTALSESLSDPINVAWLLHGPERVITREVVTRVESARPIPKQREVLLASIKEVIQAEPNHLQTFAAALCKLSTSNLKLGRAIQVDIDKYFPKVDNAFETNSDDETEMLPPSIPPPILSPIQSPSILSPSQMPITPSDTTDEEIASDSKPTPPAVQIPVPMKHCDDFKLMRLSYGKMFYQVIKIFKKNPCPLEEFKEFLFCCNSSSDFRQKVDDCTDISSILYLIRDEACSFTNIDLIHWVVEEMEITEAEKLIKDYKKKLNEFYDSMKVNLCLKEPFDSIHHLQCEVATFVFDWKPEEHILRDVETTLSKVSNRLIKIKFMERSTSILVICSFPFSCMGLVVRILVENFHILIHCGLKKLTAGNIIIWRRQDTREKELREKKPDALQDTEFLSYVVLQKAEHELNEAIESKEKEIVELKQELSVKTRASNEEGLMLISTQSDAKLMKDVEEENSDESMSEELVILRSHFSEYKKRNNEFADNLRKMEIEYPRSLLHSSHKNKVASQIRRAMALEINDLKYYLQSPDYPPLVENKREIERMQEKISLLGIQLITQREHKEKITKEINETRTKINENQEELNLKLFGAAYRGDITSARSALQAGADVNYEVGRGLTPLTAAARRGHDEIQSLLLSNGAITDKKYKGEKLVYAAGEGDITEVRAAITAGGDVNYQSNWGDDTPLTAAASSGYHNIVQLLLSEGADPNKHDYGRMTPLTAAARRGHDEIQSLLLSNGAPNDKKYKGEKLLYAAREGDITEVRAAITAGGDVNYQSTGLGRNTPLTAAASRGRHNIVQLLLSEGADPNEPDRWGRTPIIYTVDGGHHDTVSLLVSSGATPHTGSKNERLYYMTYTGDINGVSSAIDDGADVNYRPHGDFVSRTPLMIAARDGREDIVSLLLSRGADPSILFLRDGATAVSLAKKNGHHNIVEIIKKHTPGGE